MAEGKSPAPSTAQATLQPSRRARTRVRKPRYILITGSFYIRYPDLPRNGPQPDGDTITFLPDNDDLVQGLPRFSGTPPDRRHLGAYSVRFEGIDALETHFFTRHQNLQFAEAGRNRMLAIMGFREVAFFPDLPNNVKSAKPHPLRGYLIANGIEANGRVLALVYPGNPDPADLPDGNRVFVDHAKLGASVNTALVREGLAFAELYGTMPLDLIEEMRRLVKDARNAGAGFWPQESPSLKARQQLRLLNDLSSLVMFPKLYRRLVKYFEDGHEGQGLGQFDLWIRADAINRDDQALLPTGEFGNLHNLYDVAGGGIKLLFPPEDLTFQPDPPRV